MLDQPQLCVRRQQALVVLANPRRSLADETRLLLLIRSRQWNQAEVEILSSAMLSADQRQRLLLLLRLQQGSLLAAQELLDRLSQVKPELDGFLWFARQCLLLSLEQMDALRDLGLPPEGWRHPWHHLQLATAALWLGDQPLAEAQIQQLPPSFQPPERLEMAARWLMMCGDRSAALATLGPLLEHSDASPIGWELAIHLLEQTDSAQAAVPMLQRALVLYPHHPRLLGRQVVRSVLHRQPIIARRFSLLDRLYAAVDRPQRDQHRCDSNLAFAYENGGRADLLRCQHASLQRHHDDPFELGNHALQMASLADPSSAVALQRAASLLRRKTGFPRCSGSAGDGLRQRPLRLALISPDFHYHPVGRFVAMLLGSGFGRGGTLHTIALAGRDDSTTGLIQELAVQQGDWLDLRQASLDQKLDQIRALNLDLAIDLSGWTAGSDPALFASRLASVQVNYLGWFASTGLPEMDVWLGDSALFPDPIQEWHSEQIWRLPRCFLAWQPMDNLPEGRVAVPASPTSSDVVFGSFNHVRKLGEATLRLWGRILEAVPGSRLALKAYTSDDPGTVTLLRRRMRRCGLDPERVIWLPTPNAPEDHLRQYGLLDVALDPFPNGGCTTSCEALWMGVPVITLAGERYVSRMSTAVLTGAELPEWIATSEQEYFNKALQAAEQRRHLRASRAQLRQHLQASALGDAAGLNAALWQAFATMVQQPRDASAIG